MSKQKMTLVVVAHPDDETIFFGGLLLKAKRSKSKWIVVCATSDGNESRRRDFDKACRILGVDEALWWGYPDKYEQRLPVNDLVEKLQKMVIPDEVYTHGIVGEYGHPHHQDVSFAVHSAFRKHQKLYSVAYNAFPEIEIKLSPKEFEVKAKILTKVYGSETQRFLNVLPSTYVEGFLRLEFKEVEAIYNYLALHRDLNIKALKKNRWLADYLPQLRNLPRPF